MSYSDPNISMTLVKTPVGSRPWQTCRQILLWTVIVQVLLQAVSVAVTFLYVTNKLQQMQDKHSQKAIDCFLQGDESSWDPGDEETVGICLQVKYQVQQLVRKMVLRTLDESIATLPEKQQSIPLPEREKGPQRVAAHITGTTRRASMSLAPVSKNENALGQKIQSWESSRKGHSFLNNLHLRNGELVIQRTGLYYIYSQTYFRFQNTAETAKTVSKEENKKSKQMVQYIYKCTSYPDPIMLMKSARNSCWSKDAEYGLYSIYQGGIFELKENDRIFVSVTNEHLIDLDQEASFFGAFLVG